MPVCIEEAFNLCDRYPIVWRRDEFGELELVAIRSLAQNTEIPGIHQMSVDSLPLLLQAYPFRYKTHSGTDFDIGLDRVAPTQERNMGAYIYDHLGEFQLGSELKIQALETFRRSKSWEKLLTRTLTKHNMLEQIQLPAALHERYEIPRFLTAIETPQHNLLLKAIPSEGRKVVLTFLTAQRLSLFKMSAIIALSESLKAPT